MRMDRDPHGGFSHYRFFFLFLHGIWSSSVMGFMTMSQHLKDIAATIVYSYFDVQYITLDSYSNLDISLDSHADVLM